MADPAAEWAAAGPPEGGDDPSPGKERCGARAKTARGGDRRRWGAYGEVGRKEKAGLDGRARRPGGCVRTGLTRAVRQRNSAAGRRSSVVEPLYGCSRPREYVTTS